MVSKHTVIISDVPCSERLLFHPLMSGECSLSFLSLAGYVCSAVEWLCPVYVWIQVNILASLLAINISHNPLSGKPYAMNRAIPTKLDWIMVLTYMALLWHLQSTTKICLASVGHWMLKTPLSPWFLLGINSCNSMYTSACLDWVELLGASLIIKLDYSCSSAQIPSPLGRRVWV